MWSGKTTFYSHWNWKIFSKFSNIFEGLRWLSFSPAHKMRLYYYRGLFAMNNTVRCWRREIYMHFLLNAEECFSHYGIVVMHVCGINFPNSCLCIWCVSQVNFTAHFGRPSIILYVGDGLFPSTTIEFLYFLCRLSIEFLCSFAGC